MSRSDPATAAYYKAQSGETAVILEELRQQIFRLGPGLTETLAWGTPCFVGRERVLSLRAQRGGYVNLQIWYGVEIADKYPRIEGTGKLLRHVKVRTIDDIDPEILDIIGEALLLDQARPGRVP